MAAEPTENGNGLAGAFRLQLEVVAVVADLLDDDRHVEGGVEPGRRIEGFLEQGVDLPGLALQGIAGRLKRRHDAVVVGNVAEQTHRGAQGGGFVGHGQVGHARGAVDFGTTQLLGGDVLAEHRLDDAGAGQAEEGIFRLNDETPLAGKIRATAGVEAEHAHDGRHHPADLAQRGEGLGVTVEATDPGRNEGAGRVVHADQGDAFFAGHGEEPGELAAVGGVDGAGAHGEVVAVDRHVAAADIEDAGDQRGAVEILAPVLEEDVRLAFGEHLDPLPHGHPFFEMLLFNLADADRLDWALNQVVSLFHRLFIAAGGAGNFTGDNKFDLLGWIKGVFQ